MILLSFSLFSIIDFEIDLNECSTYRLEICNMIEHDQLTTIYAIVENSPDHQLSAPPPSSSPSSQSPLFQEESTSIYESIK